VYEVASLQSVVEEMMGASKTEDCILVRLCPTLNARMRRSSAHVYVACVPSHNVQHSLKIVNFDFMVKL